MISKNEHLGELKENDLYWYREMKYRISDKELTELENLMDNDNAYFCVVDRHDWSTAAIWGFQKEKPFETIAKELGGAIDRLEDWQGRDYGILFKKYEKGGWRIKNNWDYESLDIPLTITHEGRCKHVSKKGVRCLVKARNGERCSKHKEKQTGE